MIKRRRLLGTGRALRLAGSDDLASTSSCGTSASLF